MTLKVPSILVPFDFSHRSLDAIRYALSIIEQPGTVDVAYIIDDYTPEYVAVRYPGPVEEKHRVFHRQRMAEVIAASDIDSSLLNLHCEIGAPGPEIARLAGKLAVELVVIPSHGRKGLGRWILGSVAERVARLSPCPVLVLKESPSNTEVCPS